MSVKPALAVPVTVGRPDADGPPVMAAVWAEVAVPEPAELLALTTTWIVEPSSVRWVTYVVPPEPTFVQLLPAWSQRCHW